MPLIVTMSLGVGTIWWLIAVIVLRFITSSFSTFNSLIALAVAGSGVLFFGFMQYSRRERQLNTIPAKHAAELKTFKDAEAQIEANIAQLGKRLSENRSIANG